LDEQDHLISIKVAILMTNSPIERKFNAIKEKHDQVYVIISPPRCSSTAFARVFWELPSVRYYSHEPFEGTYFMGQNLDYVLDNLRNPLDLREVKQNSAHQSSNSLVIKEMPYQVGDKFPLLVSLTRKPVVFLARDPRQNIASRMSKKEEVGDNPLFPFVETGWELIASQIQYCKEQNIPYLIVDAKDFRNQPVPIFREIFDRLDLKFEKEVLTWDSRPEVDIDNLEGDHQHLYEEVLSSTGMLPDTDAIPTTESFPTENGYRDHVRECMRIYERLKASSARIRIPAERSRPTFQDRISPGD
jgi:hypothetical protein